MSKDDRPYLIHISECIERIEEYTADGREAFMNSTLIQDAVLRNLQTLAESTQRLSESLKTGHSGVPWKKISGFRNVLVHNYLGVDVQRVWELVVNDLPQLKIDIQAMLNKIS